MGKAKDHGGGRDVHGLPARVAKLEQQMATLIQQFTQNNLLARVEQLESEKQ